MDSPSQAHPAADIFSKKSVSDTVELVKGRNQGSDYFDDTSSSMSGSVLSMGSIGKSAVCAECQQPEELPQRPFVRCPKCRKIWHQVCLGKLEPDCLNSSEPNWACATCRSQLAASKASDKQRRHRSSTAKQSVTPANRSLVGSSTTKGLPRASDTIASQNHAVSRATVPDTSVSEIESAKNKPNPSVCATPGCSNPIYKFAATIHTLCNRHQMEQRHAESTATAKAKAVTNSSIPPSKREINRKKLYPLRPDDKPLVRRADDRPHLKRKRTEDEQTNVSPRVGNMNSKIAGKPAGAVQQSGNGYSGLMSGSGNLASNPETSGIRRASTDGKQTPDRPQPLISDKSVNGSASRRSSVASFINQSPRVSRTSIGGESISKRTPVVPPAHPSRVLNSPEREPSHVSPHSQAPNDSRFASLKATVENDDSSDQNIVRSATEAPSASPYPYGQPNLTSPTAQMIDTTSDTARPPSSDILETATITSKDNVFDCEPMAKALAGDTTSPSAPTEAEKELHSPAVALSPELPAEPELDVDTNMADSPDTDAQPDADLSSTVNATSSGAQLNAELEATVDNASLETDPEADWVSVRGPATCLERKIARGDYSEGALDFCLEAQRDHEDSEQATKEQLKAQNWGYINPQTAWPEEPYTNAQADAKMAEIEARGGRKAAFGKVFTAQNLQEKKENGWEIHQWQEKRTDDKAMEVVNRLERFFGVEDLLNMVPGTRNGRLVMVERDAPPEEEQRGPERRKKKNPPKVYSVHGAPNV